MAQHRLYVSPPDGPLIGPLSRAQARAAAAAELSLVPEDQLSPQQLAAAAQVTGAGWVQHSLFTQVDPEGDIDRAQALSGM